MGRVRAGDVAFTRGTYPRGVGTADNTPEPLANDVPPWLGGTPRADAVLFLNSVKKYYKIKFIIRVISCQVVRKLVDWPSEIFLKFSIDVS